MHVSIRDALRKTRTSYWQFVRYRREGLLPGPVRVEKLKGKGSSSFYPGWIIERIQNIQRLRRQGKTVPQIKEATRWKVQEKLAAVIQDELETEEGQRVPLSPYHYLTPQQAFKEIARQVGAGYSGHLVEGYTVRVEKKGGRRRLIATMDMSEADLGPSSLTDEANERKSRDVH